MKGIQGFSLVELLISILITGFISLLLIQHYLNCKKQYHDIQVSLTREYETQLITDLLRNSIRQAGFTPCVGIGWLNARDDRQPSKLMQALTISKKKREILHIARMSEDFSMVLQIENINHLMVEADNDFHKNQSILIADCFHAEVLSILEAKKYGNRWAIVLKEGLHYSYTQPAYVGEWLEEEFFIQNNKQNKPALYYKQNHAEELSSNIVGMHSVLLHKNQKNLLRIELALENNKELLIETAVRIT